MVPPESKEERVQRIQDETLAYAQRMIQGQQEADLARRKPPEEGSLQRKPEVIQRAPPVEPPDMQDDPDITPNGGKVGKVESTVLTGDKDGGVPSVDPKGWDWLYQNFPKVKGSWVRFHVLNQHLGGPGDDEGNLIPTTHLDNHSKAWRGFETDAQDAHDNEEIIHWEGKVSGYYNNKAAPVDGFPTGLNALFWIWDADAEKWNQGKSVQLKFAPPAQGQGGSMLVHASGVSAKAWKVGVGISRQAICDWLAQNREKWKEGNSDIVGALEKESYEHESWGDDVEKAIEMIESALGGKRTKRMSITQGDPTMDTSD